MLGWRLYGYGIWGYGLFPSYGKSPQVHFKAVGKMNDPTGNRAVTNIIRRHKAEKKAKSRRRRQGDQIQRAARRCSL